MIRFFISLGVLLLLVPMTVWGHPGNTDSSGGHTCRTNCGDWGLEYGEYHYHGGYDSGDWYEDEEYDYDNDYYYDSEYDYDYDSDYDTENYDYDYDYESYLEPDPELGYMTGYDHAYLNTSKCVKDYEKESSSISDYQKEYDRGIKEGHEAGLLVCRIDSDNEGYILGFFHSNNSKGYAPEVGEYNKTHYINGYDRGWEEGKEYLAEKEKQKEKESIEKQKMNSNEGQALYDRGYHAGMKAVKDTTPFNNQVESLDGEPLRIYQLGYKAGWYEGGGVSHLEYFRYWIFDKHLDMTLIAGIMLVMAILTWIVQRNSKKSVEKDSV
ncbi:YHYH domain-containing protein [Bacillus sp. 31A1R]|uniref:YHYH domain-containing protein n=1 Tax=Robertmurraya mangrovi TaxID=3098077 RepID=A0ABU5IZV1_9BACI|nr:YHYH domain-containing protein [Bacillus sp. 31A1R]MDZ5472688.1 YHYH domain-containing protein [Bacillus sp. 31A1R]